MDDKKLNYWLEEGRVQRRVLSADTFDYFQDKRSTSSMWRKDTFF